MAKLRGPTERRVLKDDRLFTLDVFILEGLMTEKFSKKNEVISRTIQIRGDQALEDLHHTIFDAFDREEEHMYEFQVGGKRPMDPKARRYVLPMALEDPFSDVQPAGAVTHTSIGSLGLKAGDAFGYWFDFGDDWWHRINVVSIEDAAPPGSYPKITKRVGESPPQYLDWDEEDENGETALSDNGIPDLLADVPNAYAARCTELVGLTDAFCDAHLDSEYRELCREMAVAICQEGSPVLKARSTSWAAGIVCAVGWVNFLTDPDQTPHMTSAQLAEGLGVSVATMQAKARLIRKMLDLIQFDPDWCLPSKLDDNPLVWMLEVNGFLIDIRMVPREAQVVAYEKGLIPYVPADRPKVVREDSQ